MTEGRRERKRRETRERITVAAMALFLKLGYEMTTMDAIADAADISRRSLFDYFPAKEDVLFANQERFLAAVAQEIRKRPREEPWPVLVERAMVHAISEAATRENIAIDTLVRRTPGIQSRYQLKYVHLERTIARALAERCNGGEDTCKRAELFAAIVVAGFRIATSASASAGRKGGYDARRHAPKEFRRFWRSLREFGEQGLAPRARERPVAGRSGEVSVGEVRRRSRAQRGATPGSASFSRGGLR